MRLTVRVPATSANLGPGFDTFGLALDLCNEVVIDTDAEPDVTWHGEGTGELPTDGTDMVSTTIAAIYATTGSPAPGLALHGINRIPLERGLGSSSSAAVAGVVAATVLLAGDASPSLDPMRIVAAAADIEGHPDNAAPATLGGFTIAAHDGFVRRLDPHASLRPVVLVPDLRLPTSRARAALPRTVSREDAVFNAAHAALTVHALTQDPSLLAVALQDRLHQDARLALVPTVRDVFDQLRAADIPVCVSGAGPSLLAFETDAREVPEPGPAWTVLRPGVRAIGYEVSVEA
jgi:homoserine kinase